jgi:ornithine carbamoyltransferase
MRDFLRVDDLTADELYRILDRADELHGLWRENRMPRPLEGKRVALWFFGQGFRNRMAFEIGARAMGGDVSYVPGDLGVNEPLEDIGHYLDNWFSLIVIRAKRHEDLLRVADDAKAPVINARTNINHPCEILGDLQFIRRKRGTLDGLNVVFSGEVTNLCMSWFEAALRLPISVTQVSPREYLLPDSEVRAMNTKAAGRIGTSCDLMDAVSHGTDLIYTDCWPKGPDAAETEKLFLPFQITESLLSRMNPKGFFLPCPPVTRGQEVSAGAMSSPMCMDYQAKDCLLHAQNAVMEFLMERQS